MKKNNYVDFVNKNGVIMKFEVDEEIDIVENINILNEGFKLIDNLLNTLNNEVIIHDGNWRFKCLILDYLYISKFSEYGNNYTFKMFTYNDAINLNTEFTINIDNKNSDNETLYIRMFDSSLRFCLNEINDKKIETTFNKIIEDEIETKKKVIEFENEQKHIKEEFNMFNFDCIVELEIECEDDRYTNRTYTEKQFITKESYDKILNYENKNYESIKLNNYNFLQNVVIHDFFGKHSEYEIDNFTDYEFDKDYVIRQQIKNNLNYNDNDGKSLYYKLLDVYTDAGLGDYNLEKQAIEKYFKIK